MSSLLSSALGWTLIHSLWQALLVYGTVTIVLRIIPSHRSSLRYVVALSSLAVVLVASAATFWWYSQVPAHPTGAVDTTYHYITTDIAAPASIGEQALTYLAAHMNLILAIWFAGTLLFSLRMAGGVWYVTTLRRASSPVGAAWQQRLDALVHQLDIHRVVTLATSVRLQAPVVLGYIKPVILVPAGMLAGLSMEQVETILLHELAHIRRHDYLANLAQMLVEALYFFNPCIWALSAQVRTEREHCCDDAVVHYGGNARAYATALVQLEEVRLRQTGVALSLAENKHQLLTRIKRIMEKSIQQNTGRERLIPAFLLVIGLVCASWVAFAQQPAETEQPPAAKRETVIAHADSIIIKGPKENNRAYYERRTTVTIGKDGQPHEITSEVYEGDEAMRASILASVSSPDMPGFPVPPRHVAAFAPMEPLEPIVVLVPNVGIAFEPLEPIEPIPPLDFVYTDSLPRVIRFGREAADVEAMQEAILEKMKGQFGDFYGQHEIELEKIMKEVLAEMEHAEASIRSADFEARRDIFEAHRLDRKDEYRKEARKYDVYRDENRRQGDVYRVEADQQAERSKHMAKQHKEMQRQDEALRKQEKVLQHHTVERRKKDDELRKEHEKLEHYHTALKDQLIKDGYIKKSDDTFEIHETETEMTVNGKKVKDKHFAEYQKLRKKYVKE
jgi:beta-lactamase regulating signal transducer with metallopeptidase domain